MSCARTERIRTGPRFRTPGPTPLFEYENIVPWILLCSVLVDRGGAETQSLFEEIVELSGLSMIFARGTVRRALSDVGVTVPEANRAGFIRAMPALKARLAAFLPPPDVAAAAKRIEARLNERR